MKNGFSTAAFRYGHSAVENYIGYINDGKTADEYLTETTKTPLTDLFFNPTLVYQHLKNVAKWMTVDNCQKGDE